MLRKANLGVSTVLSTAILTSVLCIIVFTASYVANDAINGQIENAQFDQAKNVMLALDKLIKRLVYKPESSGYVKTSFWTVTPYFTETGEKLEVWIDGNRTLEVPVNVVKIKGGPRTSVATPQNLIGNDTLLLTKISGSLGWVHTYQSAGAWIELNYSRIRCINAGTMQYFNGTGYEPYNFIEITIVKIIFKDFEVQEQASFTVRNAGLVPIQKEMEAGDFTIRVQKSGGASDECTLSDLEGITNYKTLINLVVVNIEISLEGG
mgnify:CR=1 FL=1